MIIDGKMPLYPIIARAARIQGVVKIKVTTDGRKATSFDMESGPAMLVRSTEENIMTWKFFEHTPTSFVTIFTYAIEGPEHCEYTNSSSVLHLPQEARISAEGLKTCDPEIEIKPRH